MIARIQLRLGISLRSDRGITLSELIVTMALSTVVMTMVVGFFIQITSATATANDSRNTTATGANISNELADVIRPATPLRIFGQTAPDPAIVFGTSTSLTIYSYADNESNDVRPVRVSFTQNSQNQLVESRWNAIYNISSKLWEFPSITTTPASTRVMPGGLIAPSTATGAGATERAPLFEFLDSASQPIVPVSTGLTLAQRNSVTSIRFTVRTRADGPVSSTPITVQNTVSMPNIGL